MQWLPGVGIKVPSPIEVQKFISLSGKFVIFDYVISWVKATVFFLSLEAFISIMRLFKFLGFNRHIAMLSATLKISAFDVASFNMLFAMVLMAYLTSGRLDIAVARQS
jgi:hypothetical protein